MSVNQCKTNALRAMCRATVVGDCVSEAFVRFRWGVRMHGARIERAEFSVEGATFEGRLINRAA